MNIYNKIKYLKSDLIRITNKYIFHKIYEYIIYISIWYTLNKNIIKIIIKYSLLLLFFVIFIIYSKIYWDFILYNKQLLENLEINQKLYANKNYIILFQYFDFNEFRWFLSLLLFFINIIFFLKKKDYINENNNNYIYNLNYICLTFSIFFLIHANNLFLILFLIEIINITIYIIISNQKRFFSFGEAILKLYINNTMFTLIYIYGISLLWILTKSLNLQDINYFFFIHNEYYQSFLLISILFILISFFIKLGFIFFHKLLNETYNYLNIYNYNFISIFIKFFFFQIFAIIYIEAFNFIIMQTFLFYILIPYVLISLIISTFLVKDQKRINSFFFYSSISNYNLIFLMIIFNHPLNKFYWFYFNFFYFILSVLLFFILLSLEENFKFIPFKYVSQLNLINYLGKWYKMPLEFIIIILMGIPPFPIFLGKFFFLFNLFDTYQNFIIIFIIAINLILSFYYLLILYKSINSEISYSDEFLLQNQEFNNDFNLKKNKIYKFYISLFIIIIFISPLIFYYYFIF